MEQRCDLRNKFELELKAKVIPLPERRVHLAAELAAKLAGLE